MTPMGVPQVLAVLPMVLLFSPGPSDAAVARGYSASRYESTVGEHNAGWLKDPEPSRTLTGTELARQQAVEIERLQTRVAGVLLRTRLALADQAGRKMSATSAEALEALVAAD